MEITPDELNAAMDRNRLLALKACPALADDLVSAGNEAIVRAIRNFDRSKGASFATFASHYVRCYQRRALIDCIAGVHVPHEIADYNDRSENIAKVEFDQNLHEGVLAPAPVDHIDVREAFDRLEDQDKALVRRIIIEGETLTTVAREQRTSDRNVAARLKQALDTLRQRINGKPPTRKPPQRTDAFKQRRDALVAHVSTFKTSPSVTALHESGFPRSFTYRVCKTGHLKLNRGLVSVPDDYAARTREGEGCSLKSTIEAARNELTNASYSPHASLT